MGNIEHDLIERGCRVLDPGWHEGKDHEPEGEATWDEAEEVLRPALDQLRVAVEEHRAFVEALTHALNDHGVPAMPSWREAIDYLAEHGGQ